VLVTGGNRGIGLEVVKSLLRADPACHVFVGCRDLPAGVALCAALRAEHGERVEAVELDVCSAASIERAVAAVGCGRAEPALDVLVNNAGVMPEADTSRAFALADVREALRVNFEGAVAVTEAFLPLLRRAAPPAAVLSTSSGVGARTLGLLSAADRALLAGPALGLPALRAWLDRTVAGLSSPLHSYHRIPTVGHGLGVAPAGRATPDSREIRCLEVLKRAVRPNPRSATGCPSSRSTLRRRSGRETRRGPGVGLGRIFALYHRPSTLYQIY
jgi:hypothetical protein